MNWDTGFEISGSGMTAQRVRLDTIANNLANVETTRGVWGEAYRRQVPVFQQRGTGSFLPMAFFPGGGGAGAGVRVTGIVSDPSPLRLVYDPEHPDADEEGYVAMPNVNVVMEMTDLIAATRAYEANATAFDATKSILQRALEIGG